MVRQPKISVVVPLYNEEDSVQPLFDGICSALQALVPDAWEVIFVDDGSADRTYANARECAPLVLVRLSENSGQTAAFAAGISEAKGEIIVTMDGDLENDPADIRYLIQKIEEGYDVVSGWRKDRWKSQRFTRRLPSALASRFISLMSGVRLHDHGCALKAYRREFLKGLYLFGDMHRMLAAYAARRGARIAEIPVRFSVRKFGRSKYGLSRTLRVLLDVLAFYFFKKFRSRPMHFFGWFGFWNLLLGFLTFLVMVYFKYWGGKSFIATPLPVLAAFFVIIGMQFALLGLLAEILVRTQHEVTRTPPYSVESVVKNPPAAESRLSPDRAEIHGRLTDC